MRYFFGSPYRSHAQSVGTIKEGSTTVAQVWPNLLADKDMLAISQQTLVSREESLKLMELKLHNGAASELEFKTAQTLLQSARVTVASQQRLRLQDENALVLVLGQSLPETARAALTQGICDAVSAPSG